MMSELLTALAQMQAKFDNDIVTLQKDFNNLKIEMKYLQKDDEK